MTPKQILDHLYEALPECVSDFDCGITNTPSGWRFAHRRVPDDPLLLAVAIIDVSHGRNWRVCVAKCTYDYDWQSLVFTHAPVATEEQARLWFPEISKDLHYAAAKDGVEHKARSVQ